jgi:glucose dehydrogenase
MMICRRGRATVSASASPASTFAFLACALLASTSARAADVTYERLLNPEPQNWLMHHRDFGAQRHSPLAAINTSNAKSLKLLFAVPLGGKSAGESLEATPLVDDGFMYMVDSWGVVYKIDVRSGTAGTIVWKMDPKEANQDRNRGVALWGNLVISVTGYEGRVVATDKESGQVVWEKNLTDQADLELTAAPLALKDEILVGGSGGDRGLRGWLAALDPKTGEVKWKTYSIPAPGEPGRDLEGQGQRLPDRRRLVLRHRRLRSRQQPDLLGVRQSGPGLRFLVSPGRQSLYVERHRVQCGQRQDHLVAPIYAQRRPRL